VAGDLTTAFDFTTPNRTRPVPLPDTAAFLPDDLVRHPDQVPVPPTHQRLPRQERGVRPARALPYQLHADAALAAGRLTLAFRNSGAATAVFQTYSGGAEQPRCYTVEPGRTLTDTWPAAAGYDVSVHGPNGFFREFRGRPDAATPAITTTYDTRTDTITLVFTNPTANRVQATVVDAYTTRRTTVTIPGAGSSSQQWSLSRTHGWYDFTISVDGVDGQQRYAGHLENDRDSITDPAMGGLL
jgi:phospholipase C